MSRRIWSPDSDTASSDGAPVALIPIASVALASMLATLPLMLDTPLLPPFGFLMLLSWRLMRSDLWPVWIGIPLGFWDDIFSGQPIGSAMALWTIVLVAMDALDARVVWRDYRLDWAIGGMAIAFVLIAGAFLAQPEKSVSLLVLVGPQVLISLFVLPAAMLLAGRLDAWRLAR